MFQFFCEQLSFFFKLFRFCYKKTFRNGFGFCETVLLWNCETVHFCETVRFCEIVSLLWNGSFSLERFRHIYLWNGLVLTFAIKRCRVSAIFVNSFRVFKNCVAFVTKTGSFVWNVSFWWNGFPFLWNGSPFLWNGFGLWKTVSFFVKRLLCATAIIYGESVSLRNGFISSWNGFAICVKRLRYNAVCKTISVVFRLREALSFILWNGFVFVETNGVPFVKRFVFRGTASCLWETVSFFVKTFFCETVSLCMYDVWNCFVFTFGCL